MSETIIFTHFGYQDYITKSLACATLTNANARRVLLGDNTNKSCAIDSKWEFALFKFLSSPLRDEFNSCYKDIRGSNNKQPNRWVKFVTERFFIIEAFCRNNNIESFWSFDTDVMILAPLDYFGNILRAKDAKFTSHGYFITHKALTLFCEHVIKLFKDKTFLDKQRKEFEANKNYVFTEMRMYENFLKTNLQTSLSSTFPDWIFDSALCHTHDCKMITPANLSWGETNMRSIKKLSIDGNGDINITKANGVSHKAATINCSWVPLSIFDWILTNVIFKYAPPYVGKEVS